MYRPSPIPAENLMNRLLALLPTPAVTAPAEIGTDR